MSQTKDAVVKIKLIVYRDLNHLYGCGGAVAEYATIVLDVLVSIPEFYPMINDL